MRIIQYFVAVVVIVTFLPTSSFAQFVQNGLHTRVSDGANAEANGGNDSSLIGINAGGVNNWGLNQWDLSSLTGETVTSVSLFFDVQENFTNANHGSTLDTISIHEIFSTNAGWLEGGQVVNGTNVETNGGATFNFQSQTSATTGTAWQDAAGNDLSNLLGAFDTTAIDSIAGYDQGTGPDTVSFNLPVALVQGWVDDPSSFAGLVLQSNDNGDNLGRFNFLGNPGTLSITTAAVPEPSSLAIVGMFGIAAFMRRRR